MRRVRSRWLGAFCLLAALTGCDEAGPPSSASLDATVFAPTRQAGEGKLAYRHELTVGLSPQQVSRHFAASRDRCLNEASLRCVLIRSSVSEGKDAGARPFAQLEVRLPHESVPAFVAFVTSPLPGEAAGDVILRDQSTRSEDLANSIADTARRLTQLADYRDRLNGLSARSDPRVEDLIKIANELSQVQSQIEELEGKRRGFEERVSTEIVAVAFRSDWARESAFVPVVNAWEKSGRTLGESAAAALRFAVASLPWLPVLALVVLMIRWVWRLRRRKRRAEPAPIP